MFSRFLFLVATLCLLALLVTAAPISYEGAVVKKSLKQAQIKRNATPTVRDESLKRAAAADARPSKGYKRAEAPRPSKGYKRAD